MVDNPLYLYSFDIDDSTGSPKSTYYYKNEASFTLSYKRAGKTLGKILASSLM